MHRPIALLLPTTLVQAGATRTTSAVTDGADLQPWIALAAPGDVQLRAITAAAAGLRKLQLDLPNVRSSAVAGGVSR
jgi:hypothetical protein